MLFRSRAPKVLHYLGRRTPDGDPTQWINMFIEDHFTHMKPLSGDNLLTPEEARDWNTKIKGWSNLSRAHQNYARTMVNTGQQPYTPNATTVQSASGYVGSTNVVVTGFKDYKGRDIKLSAPAAVSWQAMIDAGMPFNPGDVHSVYRDEAEWKRLRAQGFSASATSAHNLGEAMDVHGLTGDWLKKHGHKYGWGPEGSYGHGSHGGHFIFTGWNN